MAIDEFEEIMQLQRQMASRVVQENEMELQMKLLEIIGSLVKTKSKHVSSAQIFTAAELEGIPEEEAMRLLKTLEDLNYVKRSGGNYLIV